MTETSNEPLSRTAASAAVETTGWRYLLSTYAASVPVATLSQGLDVAAAASTACGAHADTHLRVDVRADRIELALQSSALERITARDVELAHKISTAVAGLGLPLNGPTTEGPARSVQSLEIGIDALDIPAIRSFWKAVLGYVDEGAGEVEDGLMDSVRQGPTVWFQQMDEPRPQRNRIHFDITVSHDEAPARIQAALDAGGVLLSEPRRR